MSRYKCPFCGIKVNPKTTAMSCPHEDWFDREENVQWFSLVVDSMEVDIKVPPLPEEDITTEEAIIGKVLLDMVTEKKPEPKPEEEKAEEEPSIYEKNKDLFGADPSLPTPEEAAEMGKALFEKAFKPEDGLYKPEEEKVESKTENMTILIEKDEDSKFIISCPEIQGCYTQGDTINEALDNIKEVIELLKEEEKAGKLNIPNFTGGSGINSQEESPGGHSTTGRPDYLNFTNKEKLATLIMDKDFIVKIEEPECADCFIFRECCGNMSGEKFDREACNSFTHSDLKGEEEPAYCLPHELKSEWERMIDYLHKTRKEAGQEEPARSCLECKHLEHDVGYYSEIYCLERNQGWGTDEYVIKSNLAKDCDSYESREKPEESKRSCLTCKFLYCGAICTRHRFLMKDVSGNYVEGCFDYESRDKSEEPNRSCLECKNFHKAYNTMYEFWGYCEKKSISIHTVDCLPETDVSRDCSDYESREG